MYRRRLIRRVDEQFPVQPLLPVVASRQSTEFISNMMFTSTNSNNFDDIDDDSYVVGSNRPSLEFTTNPLTNLSASVICNLESSGWSQLLDSDGVEYFLHNTSGAISYDMPTEEIMLRLSTQRECVDKLTLALRSLGDAGGDQDLIRIRLELTIDLETIEYACSVINQSICSATMTVDALARADTNLMTLETLITDKVKRSGNDLWGTVRAVVDTSSISPNWNDLLDKIKQVRDNLKPVQEATRPDAPAERDGNAWVRSLRNKLRPINVDP